MEGESRPFEWSSQLQLAHHSIPLFGDKISLPPSSLEQLLAAAPLVSESGTSISTSSFDPYNPYSYAAERRARAQVESRDRQLPRPLTFRLVNPINGRIAYAGVREFGAEEGSIQLSSYLQHALGFEEVKVKIDGDAEGETNDRLQRVTVHAHILPKGVFVKLRPVEAGYDPEDWKSLLEEHLRKNYTTLTRGELFTVPAGRDSFEFLIDEFKPEGDGICVVDTDLEVDIEALNEDQARETLRKISEKKLQAPGTELGSSSGGRLDLFRAQSGQVLEGDYVDYEIPSWVRSQGLEVELMPKDDEHDLYLFASPFSSKQRVKPRQDEHVFSNFESRPTKRLRLSPTNVELETAEAIWVSVYGVRSGEALEIPKGFSINAKPFDIDPSNSDGQRVNGVTTPEQDEVQCKNCQQYVPKQSLVLHENFCLRNNTTCPRCHRVFQKRSEAWANHWHCEHTSCSGSGDSPGSRIQHNSVFHTTQSCPSCPHISPSLPLLAQHRTSTCPGKLILCRFCHLQVPQEGDPEDPSQAAELILTGLTAHELSDGGRTTECHLCNRITRLRDMDTHLRHHDLERKSRPIPRVCRNLNCGRTLDGTSHSGDTRAGERRGQGAGNDIGLCSTCFGPLYVSMYDPEGKALKRRVERRYLSQLLTGCGKPFCKNPLCKAGRVNAGVATSGAAVSTKDALPMVKPFVDGLTGGTSPLHFCVDEKAQNARGMAEMMSAEGDKVPGQKKYRLGWCVGALEAEGADLGKAREWLCNFALAVDEER